MRIIDRPITLRPLQCKAERCCWLPLCLASRERNIPMKKHQKHLLFSGERRRGSFRKKNPLHPARWAIVVVKRCPNDDPRFPFKKSGSHKKRGKKGTKENPGKTGFVPPHRKSQQNKTLSKKDFFEWRAVRTEEKYGKVLEAAWISENIINNEKYIVSLLGKLRC